MPESHMERFWDARAKEDALFFVDSRLEYGSADLDTFWAGGEQAVERLLGSLGVDVSPEAVVVDIGCGVGRLTRALATRAQRVIGLDVSGEMLNEARRLNADLSNVEWLHGDGASLQPIPDARADACISHVVFRHIPDPQITLGYIREMGRVLRPGGFAAFELSNDPQPHRRRRVPAGQWLRSWLRRAPRGVTDEAWLGAHVELNAVREAAAEAGMSQRRVIGEGTEFCAVLLVRDPH